MHDQGLEPVTSTTKPPPFATWARPWVHVTSVLGMFLLESSHQPIKLKKWKHHTCLSEHVNCTLDMFLLEQRNMLLVHLVRFHWLLYLSWRTMSLGTRHKCWDSTMRIEITMDLEQIRWLIICNPTRQICVYINTHTHTNDMISLAPFFKIMAHHVTWHMTQIWNSRISWHPMDLEQISGFIICNPTRHVCNI